MKLYNVLLFLLLLTFSAMAQKMQVIRCTAPEFQAPVQNIYVDNDNKKWISNSNGLFQVHAIDFAQPMPLPSGQQSLLNIPNGNRDIQWTTSEMSTLIENETITTAFYNTQNREVWIGTAEAGVFRVKTSPNLLVVGKINSGNSKLKSDRINAISKDNTGRLWIGTEEGVLVGSEGKWKLMEKFFNIESIAINRGHIWVMGDNTVWEVEEKDEFYPIDIQDRMVEGDIRDIAVDSRGKLWIASEIVSRYDAETETFQAYGPAQYFTSQAVNFIQIDDDDALWVGTQDKGLFLIEKASAITVTCLIDKNLDCDFQSPNAAIKVRVTGGQPPYSYNWENNLTGENPRGLGPGLYKVTVTDSRDKKNTGTIAIPDPRMKVSLIQQKEESGAGVADARAKVSVEGGQAPYTFVWSSGETTEVANKLSEGNHSVTVTDKNGCTTIGTITISQQLLPLNIIIAQIAENDCQGDQKAALEVQVSGGKSPFSYQWNEPNVTTEKRTNLAAGEYTITVSDATGATSYATLSISDPAALNLSADLQSPASTNNSDGKARAKASGGNGGYTFKWDSGETTEVATKLANGKHTVTVTDSKGCSATATVDINENIQPLNVSINQTSGVNCTGDKSAALSVEVSGGKPPFDFKWNQAGMNGETPQNLGVGTYNLTITDAAGTTSTSNFNIKEPEPILINITLQNAATTGNADGKAKAQVSGGTSNYSYKWDNGETEKIASKLSPGIHTLIVTDAKGCTATASVEVSENILPLSVSINKVAEINCQGGDSGALSTEINGGKPPFSYQWNAANLSGDHLSNLTAGNYELTITDGVGTTASANFELKEPASISAKITVQAPASTGNADGKAKAQAEGGTGNYSYKWDNGETEKSATQLSPGTHSLTVTDGNGCTATASVEVSENILPLSVVLNQTTQINCQGGTDAGLAAEVNGGKPPFSYQWSTNDVNQENRSNLGAGNYLVTITDAVGTTASASFTISEPAGLSAKITVQSPASTGNSDGKAEALVSGGTGNYSYKWDNGEVAKVASQLAPGMHQVTVTDVNGCTITGSTEITENILPLAVKLETTSTIKCQGGKEAALEATVSGGKPPFNYQWNQGALKGNIASNLSAGNYELTVTDAANQTATATISLNQPQPLTAEITRQSPATETDSQDGKAVVEAKGGTGNYTYQWDNGETSDQNRKLAIGDHSVIVSDENGCTASANVEIKKKIIPELTVGRLRLGQTIRLSQLYFDADSTVLSESSRPVLDELFYFLDQNPGIAIEIGGHTNGVPPHEYCDNLSSARAQSISKYLVQKGVIANRVEHKGYGKRNPIASNKTEAGRKRNQRVEIKILRLEEGG